MARLQVRGLFISQYSDEGQNERILVYKSVQRLKDPARRITSGHL